MKTKEIRKKIKEIEIDNYLKLIKWLYDNYKDILREYEASQGKLRVEFAE